MLTRRNARKIHTISAASCRKTLQTRLSILRAGSRRADTRRGAAHEFLRPGAPDFQLKVDLWQM